MSDAVPSGWRVDPSELAAHYRDALWEAGYTGGALPPSSSSGKRPKTFTREAFEVFAQLRAAPEVLTIIELFAEQARLRDRDDFSVSCLPGNSSVLPGRTRTTAVSVGQVEVLVVELDRATRAVAQVTVWGERDEDPGELLSRSRVRVRDSYLDGGGIALELPGAEALDLITDPDLGRMVARRVAEIRRRRRRSRRRDWHNRWLWALVESGVASPPWTVPAVDTPTDVSSPDVLSLVRRRTGQRKFRALLLANQPNECAVCGIDVIDVLEAAHLVAHARGGPASVENGRLLCANHHRAYDAGLYRWTGTGFHWVGEGPEPTLGRG